jgi:UDP:flavonoid glycosyltransferase YjiC (YdhE family)
LSKILICTRGSLGDVLPYIGLAHGLQKSGHHVLMVVNSANLGVVNKQGIECMAFDVGQDTDAQNNKTFKGLTQSLLGSLKVLRKLGKHLRQEVACIQRLAPSFDLIMGSQTSLAAPLVARALGKPGFFLACRRWRLSHSSIHLICMGCVGSGKTRCYRLGGRLSCDCSS